MTTETKKPAAKAAAKIEDTVAVKPAVAVHSIVVGKDERVAPGSFYTPVDEAQRDELLALGAIRELEDESEIALYEKIEASKAPVDPEGALG